MEKIHKFNYRWNLTDLVNVEKNGCKVFSTFSCGGGSTMGYKLAGYEVIGNLEIDKRKNAAYIKNHSPRFNYQEDIRKFRVRDDLPQELYELDILDGSPPCKSFSVCGAREETWGKVVKKYGITQTWDDLFFEFIALAEKLQPKVVVGENVFGILQGDARSYVRDILNGFDDAGYYIQYYLLDSANMGVPQKRRRVFFIGLRKDLALRYGLVNHKDLFFENVLLDMGFNEPPIPFGEVKSDENDYPLTEQKYKLWEIRQYGDIDLSFSCARDGQNPNKFFNSKYLYDDKVSNTITVTDECILYSSGRHRNIREVILCASFPLDYDFVDSDVRELCGRSVPPVMMAQIASRIYEQWLSKIPK